MGAFSCCCLSGEHPLVLVSLPELVYMRALSGGGENVPRTRCPRPHLFVLSHSGSAVDMSDIYMFVGGWFVVCGAPSWRLHVDSFGSGLLILASSFMGRRGSKQLTCSSALLRSLQLCLEKIFYSLASACGRSAIRACSALLAARYSSSSCGLLVLRSPSGV
ncbi:unnamed protein product [Amoebophrya sp. A120]|nr:unnamed protein product [Amoebophrya sp. A120]|eukprot:GSA120T00011070001.1